MEKVDSVKGLMESRVQESVNSQDKGGASPPTARSTTAPPTARSTTASDAHFARHIRSADLASRCAVGHIEAVIERGRALLKSLLASA